MAYGGNFSYFLIVEYYFNTWCGGMPVGRHFLKEAYRIAAEKNRSL